MRLFHLDEMAEADDDEVSREHKLLARYIKHFIEVIPFEVEQIYKAEEAKADKSVEKFDPTTGGTAYMEPDGDTPGLEN